MDEKIMLSISAMQTAEDLDFLRRLAEIRREAQQWRGTPFAAMFLSRRYLSILDPFGDAIDAWEREELEAFTRSYRPDPLP